MKINWFDQFREKLLTMKLKEPTVDEIPVIWVDRIIKSIGRWCKYNDSDQ